MGDRSVDLRPEIAPVLKCAAHSLRIFLEFAGIVGAGEEVLQENRVRNPHWPKVPHRRAQLARAHRPVAGEGDIPHFHRGAFLDDEVDRDRGGRDGLDFRLYRRELVPVFGQQFADHIDRPRQPGGIIGAFHREAGDMLFLEAVQNIRSRDRVQALVVDLADGWLFFNDDVENNALGGILPRNLQILEVSGVPERVEVALDGRRIVGISGVGKQPRQHRLSGNAAIADHSDLGHNTRLGSDVLLSPGNQTGTAK